MKIYLAAWSQIEMLDNKDTKDAKQGLESFALLRNKKDNIDTWNIGRMVYDSRKKKIT